MNELLNNDIFLALSFSVFPMLSAIVLSLITTPLGISLYFRNEILFGIALPPMGSAALAMTVFLGVPESNKLLLYIVTIMFIFLSISLLSYNKIESKTSIPRREMLLASLFVLGHTFTYLIMSVSPHANHHLDLLLKGQILAISKSNFIMIAVLGLLLITTLFYFRGLFYSYCLDEEQFRLRSKYYKLIFVSYRLVLSSVITGGIILVGPLLTTAFLVFPALLAEKLSKSVESYFAIAILIAVFGTFTGFVFSVIIDIAPVYSIVPFLLFTGLTGLGLKRIFK